MEKVAEVLAGLRDERKRLVVELSGVDRAIAALEEVLGIERVPEERTVTASAARAAVEPPAAAPQPEPGPYASPGLYAAVAAYLTDAGEPKTAREIAVALQAGGYPTRATNFTATVRTMLQRTLSSREYGIRATPTGGRWFMTN
ncbi:MAG TPA: hypothetical protein VE974_09955 [Thermoanaerobaculia bacterium]|nr:hypothetical protein [Thermoanaerobaculia bacterium]